MIALNTVMVPSPAKTMPTMMRTAHAIPTVRGLTPRTCKSGRVEASRHRRAVPANAARHSPPLLRNSRGRSVLPRDRGLCRGAGPGGALGAELAPRQQRVETA